MSTTTIAIIVVAVAALALLAVLFGGSGGPRVTQIDRTVRKDKDSDDA